MMNDGKKVFLGLGLWCLTVGLTMTVFGRDPFFPLGYEVKKEVPLTPTVSKEPQKLPTAKREVTSEEWDAARKSIQVTGFASAGNRQIVLLNGRSYRAGEKITLTVQGVVFSWRIELPEDRKLNLVPLEAVRL
jgi:hypothetical protein